MKHIKHLSRIALLTLALSATSCVRLLTDAEIASWDDAGKVALQVTESSLKAKVPVSKIAVISLASSQGSGARACSAAGALTGIDADCVQQEIKKSLEYANQTLGELKFNVVPTETVIANPAFQQLGKDMPWGWINAMPTSAMLLGGWSISVSPSPEDIDKVVQALGVDGVVLSTCTVTTSNVVEICDMALLARDPANGNKTRLAWHGKIKSNAYAYDPKHNLSQVINSAIRLLALRMSQELAR